MKRFISVLALTMMCSGNVLAGDMAVVQKILEANSLSWSAQEVAEVQNGRVVKLDLKNRDFPKSGIEKLPADIGGLSELTELDLEDNTLTELPQEIGELKSLSILNLASNDLYSLPSSIGNLKQLKELYMKSNELDSLPSSIKNLKNLEILHMWANSFESLPSEIGQLSGLKELYLADNKLKTLPQEITKLKLNYIDIQDNKLCGLKGKVDSWLKNFDDEYLKLQRCKDEFRFQ